MKKLTKWFTAFLAFALAFCCASCQYAGDEITNVTNIIYKDAEDESKDFITENVPVYKNFNSASPSTSMFVRFYEGNSYIPYVSARYYLENFCSFAIKDTKYVDHKFSYKNTVDGKDFAMVLDTAADTIYCPDWYGYTIRTGDSYTESDEGQIYEKYLYGVEFFSGQKPMTFELAKYGFKIYEAIDDAYIPLCVMNQLFSANSYNNFFYNGKAVYLSDYSHQGYDNYRESPWYVDENGNIINRPAELVDLSYNLLCFTHDYLYGHSGYYGFADKGDGYADESIVKAADALDFDRLLTQYAPDVKANLKSSSYSEYVYGLVLLFNYVYGDLHTWPLFGKYRPNFDDATVKRINDPSDFSTKYQKCYSLLPEYKQAGKTREIKVGNDPIGISLLSGGKTAIIRFDGFEFDDKGWNEYYKQENLVAEPDLSDNEVKAKLPAYKKEENGEIVDSDTASLFYTSFWTILNDEDYAGVKNVIIDISCNRGGIDWAMFKALSYMIGVIENYQYDIHTDTTNKKIVYCDLNLDGIVWDAKDIEYHNRLVKTTYIDANGNEKTDGRGLNFAVLTSFDSFSCGNTFPAICADNGIPVIGERSGGGSSMVALGATVDGFPYSYSYKVRNARTDGSSVEGGIPVVKELTHEQFYDDATLQSVMDELFGE